MVVPGAAAAVLWKWKLRSLLEVVLQLPLESHKIQPSLPRQHLCFGCVITEHPCYFADPHAQFCIPRAATQPAQEIAATVLKTVSNRDGKLYLALAFARAGNTEQARKMADALDQDTPLDTLVQNYSLPTIRAAMKLNANDPVGAISALQPSLKYELFDNFSFNSCRHISAAWLTCNWPRDVWQRRSFRNWWITEVWWEET